MLKQTQARKAVMSSCWMRTFWKWSGTILCTSVPIARLCWELPYTVIPSSSPATLSLTIPCWWVVMIPTMSWLLGSLVGCLLYLLAFSWWNFFFSGLLYHHHRDMCQESLSSSWWNTTLTSHGRSKWRQEVQLLYGLVLAFALLRIYAGGLRGSEKVVKLVFNLHFESSWSREGYLYAFMFLILKFNNVYVAIQTVTCMEGI